MKPIKSKKKFIIHKVVKIVEVYEIYAEDDSDAEYQVLEGNFTPESESVAETFISYNEEV